MGLFGKIIGALKKTKDNISSKLNALFAKNKLGDDFYDELEEILISADISVTTAEDVIDQIRAEAKAEKLKDREFVVNLLKDVIEDTLCEAEVPEIEYPAVIMLVGVNGVGKTTTIGKLANYFVKQKKSVTVAAADTFRAAAADQLSVWADRAKVRIVKHEEGSDPSAVVFDAISSAKAKKTDVVIVDTAGRLHVKANLMEELKKMDRVVERDYPEAHFYKLLVLDATTGQNAMSQARIFDEAVDLVLFAFEKGVSGDILVQKAPACTIQTQAEAVCELFGYDKKNIKIIGIRHGEKIYETLLTNEECATAVDMGNFYRVPCDKRSLNYDKYFKEGDTSLNTIEEFSSQNTRLLTLEETKEKISELEYIKNRLSENGEKL